MGCFGMLVGQPCENVPGSTCSDCSILELHLEDFASSHLENRTVLVPSVSNALGSVFPWSAYKAAYPSSELQGTYGLHARYLTVVDRITSREIS